MTVYVSTMVLRSLRMIGEKARGDTLTSTEQVECLYELNSFMDACAIERLLCYQVLQESFPLATGTSSYSIGPGATFNTVRPTKIVDPCYVRDSSNFDTPLDIIGVEAYGNIRLKNVGNTYPQALSYDQGYDSSGYGRINVYPLPSASLTLFINSWKQVGQFSTMSMAVTLPPGYQTFIESNFAIHEAAGMTGVSAEVVRIARDSKAAVKSLNIPDTIMSLDLGMVNRRRSSILTGP